MSSSSDLHIETMNLERDWLDLAADILSQDSVGKAHRARPHYSEYDELDRETYRYSPDIVFTPVDSADVLAVEISILRWRKNWVSNLARAIAHMEQILARSRYPRGIIILTADFSDDLLVEINNGLGDRIEIWGLSRIAGLIPPNNHIRSVFDDIVAETLMDGPAPIRIAQTPEEGRGATIAEHLRRCQPGQPGWRDFESHCYEAVRLLFGNELQNLTTQNRSDDELNRMDLIGRIRGEPNTFWSMIAGDFASRYVVFEAKNNTKKIGQTQIHSTAKYLMRNGLRKVAIMLARQGANDHARQACAGYLRHDGFLILTLSLEDLCKMLLSYDAGEVPENLLFTRMDEALMALNR